jgi:integrase
LASNTVTLDPGTTKNDDGRVITMTEEVRTLLTACIVAKQQDDYVFTREDGNRVKNFRKIWQSVCERASVPELLFHDLRRTGVRNLRRLGVAETTAMKISGHKTRSTFERYNIIDQRDLAEAAELLNAKQKSKALEFRSGSGRVATETENSQAPSLALGLLN